MKYMLSVIVSIIAFSLFPTSIAFAKYIDAHNHITGMGTETAVEAMDKYGISKMIVMPPPYSLSNRNKYEIDRIIPLLNKYPGRFVYLGGGGSLNLMIQRTKDAKKIPPKMRNIFRRRALDLLSRGISGFGELSIEHLSLGPKHEHQSAPADHPLFLLLADIAAQNNVPIDIHMEIAPATIKTPSHVLGTNPEKIQGNKKAFERLLAHNPHAKIIWSHVGWDNTGYRTPALMDEMLSKYPNLYMSFKVSSNDSIGENRPLDDNGNLKGEWLELIRKHSDRFIIGADQFYLPKASKRRVGPPSVGSTNEFHKQLPPDLAQKVGYDNAAAIFNLSR